MSCCVCVCVSMVGINESISVLAQILLLENRVYVSDTATCFDLNKVICKLLNNYRKDLMEDNIQLIRYYLS